MPVSLPEDLSSPQVFYFPGAATAALWLSSRWSADIGSRLSACVSRQIEAHWHALNDGLAPDLPSQLQQQFDPAPDIESLVLAEPKEDLRTVPDIPTDWPKKLQKHGPGAFSRLSPGWVDYPISWSTPFSPLSAYPLNVYVSAHEDGTIRFNLSVGGIQYETPSFRRLVELLGPDWWLDGANRHVSSRASSRQFRLLSIGGGRPDWHFTDDDEVDDERARFLLHRAMNVDRPNDPAGDLPWIVSPAARQQADELREDRTALWPINRELIRGIMAAIDADFGIKSVRYRSNWNVPEHRLPFDLPTIDPDGPLEWGVEPIRTYVQEIHVGREIIERGCVPPDRQLIEQWCDWAKRRRDQ